MANWMKTRCDGRAAVSDKPSPNLEVARSVPRDFGRRPRWKVLSRAPFTVSRTQVAKQPPSPATSRRKKVASNCSKRHARLMVDRCAREQRGPQLLHPHCRLPDEPVAPLLQINVRTPFILSHNVLPDMKASDGHCAIVNISSGRPSVRARPTSVLRHGGTMYGATKAALERFTQGLAEEVAECGNIAVSAVSPSRVVPTPGTVHHKLVEGMEDPKVSRRRIWRIGLASDDRDIAKINGRVTYSQVILSEFGWIGNPLAASIAGVRILRYDGVSRRHACGSKRLAR